MKLADKFLAQRSYAGSAKIGKGFFSTCHEYSPTTVLLANSGLESGFVKLLTGIVMNKYFRKHFGTDYMLAMKREQGFNFFLMRKLDTNIKYTNDEYLERYFHAHELGTLYKAVFYPYMYRHKQDMINEIWLDAKTDNVGYFKNHLVLFDAIPSLDDSKISAAKMIELCEYHSIPYIIS